MVTPFFATLVLNDIIGLLKSIRRLNRGVMSSAADEPQINYTDSDEPLNRPGFLGEYFSWELRLPDLYSRWKHNMPVRLLPVGYAPAFPAASDCCTSQPTPAWPVPLRCGFPALTVYRTFLPRSTPASPMAFIRRATPYIWPH